jgi:hypothetical protein
MAVVAPEADPFSRSPMVEGPTGPSDGPVVLDIGPGVGAVVILTDAERDGSEIEVRRVGSEWDGTHVAVRSRPAAGEPVYAAVFGQLPEGRHQFRFRWAEPHGPVVEIDVPGGSVVERVWDG